MWRLCENWRFILPVDTYPNPPFQNWGLASRCWWSRSFLHCCGPPNSSFGSSFLYLVNNGIQPNLYRSDLGSALFPLCSHFLCGLLYALLALGLPAGQTCVLWHFPEVLVPRARWEPADDGDGGGVWALCLLPGHPQHRMENLHHCDRIGLWPPPPGGAHRPHGMLRIWAHLQDCGKSGWRNSVCGG